MPDEKSPGPGSAETARLDRSVSLPQDSKLHEAWNRFHDTFVRILREYPFLVTIAAMALVAELGYAILNIATLPMHLDVDLRAPEYTGWVLASFLTLEAIAKAPFGAIGDRIGRKPLLVLGPLWSGLCCLAMYYMTQPWEFIVVHGLNGLGLAAFWPSCFSTIADRVRQKDMTLAMSVFNLTYMLGVAIGPLAKALAGNQDLRKQLVDHVTADRVHRADQFWRLAHPHASHASLVARHTYNWVTTEPRVVAHMVRINEYDMFQLAARYGITNQHRFPFLMVAALFAFTSIVALLFAPSRKQAAAASQAGTKAGSVAAANGSAEGKSATTHVTAAELSGAASQAPAADENSGAIANPHATPSEPILQQILFGIRTIPWIMVIAFTIFMGIGFITPCIMPYVLKVYSITEKQFGIILLPVAAMIGILAMPMGRFGDKWGTTRSIRIGMCACETGVLLVFLQPIIGHRLHHMGLVALGHVVGSEWIMVVLMTMVGLGFILANPAWMARVAEMAPPNKSGTVLGAATTAQGVGALLGNLIGGHLWAQYSDTFPEAPMFGCAVMLGIGTIITLAHIQREPVPPQAPPLAR